MRTSSLPWMLAPALGALLLAPGPAQSEDGAKAKLRPGAGAVGMEVGGDPDPDDDERGRTGVVTRTRPGVSRQGAVGMEVGGDPDPDDDEISSRSGISVEDKSKALRRAPMERAPAGR